MASGQLVDNESMYKYLQGNAHTGNIYNSPDSQIFFDPISGNAHVHGSRRISASYPYPPSLHANQHMLKANKEQLLQSRDKHREQFTIELLQAIIDKYNKGHSTFRIRFNEDSNINNFKQDVGHNFLEYAINHLQSKDFMCTIEDLRNNNVYNQEYVIHL